MTQLDSFTDDTYIGMLARILDEGTELITRNSVCKRMRNLTVTFTSTPLVSVRKTAWRTSLREWEWFMSGSSNLKYLHPSAQPWWKPWAEPLVDKISGMVIDFLPAHYGAQLRHYNETTDQIKYILDGIKNHPNSRRLVATTWHAEEMQEVTLTTCHGTIIQCFVEPGGHLHMTMYQRSADMVVGVPCNWAQYWGFLMWLAHRTDTRAASFTWIGGDCHIYKDHYELARELTETNIDGIITPQLVYGGAPEAEFLAEDFTLDREYSPIITTRATMVV